MEERSEESGAVEQTEQGGLVLIQVSASKDLALKCLHAELNVAGLQEIPGQVAPRGYTGSICMRTGNNDCCMSGGPVTDIGACVLPLRRAGA